jgi:hypothetical protein
MRIYAAPQPNQRHGSNVALGEQEITGGGSGGGGGGDDDDDDDDCDCDLQSVGSQG